MIKTIEKLGRGWTSFIVTVFSTIVTQVIVRVLYLLSDKPLQGISFISSIVTPLLIAPGLSWLFFGLLLRVNNVEHEMRSLASIDALTGLYNRHTFYSVANHLISLMGREKECVSALFIDIDHFKKVNDKHGHLAGDVVLKDVARHLRESIRTSDTLGRIGGEEFVILLPRTKLEHAAMVGEKIRKAIESRSVQIGPDKHIKVTISVGIATAVSGSSMCVDELIKLADAELYKAKSTGRNRVSCQSLDGGYGIDYTEIEATKLEVSGKV